MKKGIHPENYRPVVFKDMSNEDVFITVLLIRWYKSKFLTLLTRSTLVNLNWWIQQVVLISS